MPPEKAYAEALRRILKAKETGASDLNLSHLDSLNQLPRELARLTSLQSLDLSFCEQLRGDLAPLASLTSLQSLDLSFCEQLRGGVTPLASLTSLRELSLAGCEQLSGNLTPLAGLTSLRELYLSKYMQLSDLTPLAKLTCLQSLDLSHCLGFRRFAPLESLLRTLKYLSLFGCKLDDLPPEICGKKNGQNVLNKVRAHYGQRPDAFPKTTKAEPPQVLVSYAWGDTSPNASEEDHQRQEVVDRLCQTLEREHWQVVRDKNALRYGDLISTFMKTLGQADLVIVVLSAKYLQSPYCMTELHALYQNARQEKQQFLNHIIPLVLKDASIGKWRDRVTCAKHWEAEFKAMEQDFTHLGEEDLRLYKAMKRWHNEVGDMLTYVNDVLHPHGFEDIVKDDFAGLHQMLRRR
jgi:internalin A